MMMSWIGTSLKPFLVKSASQLNDNDGIAQRFPNIQSNCLPLLELVVFESLIRFKNSSSLTTVTFERYFE
jgi:hypothetical protein